MARKKLQKEYWTQFRDLIESRDMPLRARKPNTQQWYNKPIWKIGLQLKFTVNTVENRLYTQLIMKFNSEAFLSLEQYKEHIEEETGESFIWYSPEEVQGESNRTKITLRREGDLTEKGNEISIIIRCWNEESDSMRFSLVGFRTFERKSRIYE
jgi:hypothetical protein